MKFAVASKKNEVSRHKQYMFKDLKNVCNVEGLMESCKKEGTGTIMTDDTA